MFLKREWPETIWPETRMAWMISFIKVKIPSIMWFFLQFLAETQKNQKMSFHILAFQNIPSNFNFFSNKNLHFLSRQGFLTQPPTPNGQVFFWTAPLMCTQWEGTTRLDYLCSVHISAYCIFREGAAVHRGIDIYVYIVLQSADPTHFGGKAGR